MENKHHKEKRPIDLLPNEPYNAIADVCRLYDMNYILKELPIWFRMSLSHDSSAYDVVEERARFIEFYDDLLPFIEAAYVFAKEKMPQEQPAFKPTKWSYHPEYLSIEERADPMIIIIRFCELYPLLYVRIELWDFLQAVQFYKGPLKEKIYQYDTSCLHLYIQALVEAFYQILEVK